VARLWQAVQEDMGLPAPGIAINGLDGYQLWFSLASPIATPRAVAFLELLHARYWAEIPPERIGITPALMDHGGRGLKPLRQPGAIPPFAAKEGQWAAFVARDLAPVFADTPWLDIPPNPDGQADLLNALRIGDADMIPPLLAERPTPATQPSAEPASSATPSPSSSPACNKGTQDPRQFLLQVMNDPSADLALRKLCKQVGLEGVSLHSFRRTAAQDAVSRGHALHVVQQLTGHKSLGSLGEYLQATPEQVLAAIG